MCECVCASNKELMLTQAWGTVERYTTGRHDFCLLFQSGMFVLVARTGLSKYPLQSTISDQHFCGVHSWTQWEIQIHNPFIFDGNH